MLRGHSFRALRGPREIQEKGVTRASLSFSGEASASGQVTSKRAENGGQPRYREPALTGHFLFQNAGNQLIMKASNRVKEAARSPG